MAHVESDEGARGTVESALDATGASIVKVSGEIDMSNAELLGQILEQIVGAGGGPLVVDLAALQFMDSSGIAILLRAAARVDSSRFAIHRAPFAESSNARASPTYFTWGRDRSKVVGAELRSPRPDGLPGLRVRWPIAAERGREHFRYCFIASAT